MKVLMVSKACVVGAYHKKLEEISRHPGVQLTLIVPPAYGKMKLESSSNQYFEIVVKPISFSGHNHFHFYHGIAAEIARLKPDIIHIDEESHSYVTFQVLRHRGKSRTLFFNWQNIYKNYPPPFCWIERYVFRNVTAGIAGNTEAADVLRRKGFARALYVIPQFGVDTDIFRRFDAGWMADLKTKLGIKDTFNIGYAGRLVPEKGIGDLLNAFAKLPNTNLRLIIMGDGPQKDNLQTLAGKLNVGDKVIFLQHVKSAEMPLYINCLNVLVLPSHTMPNWKEQFGRVLIEAMACGVPIVGSDSGEIPVVLGDSGLIFMEGDVNGLTEKLRTLINDATLRAELGKKGRERAINNYTQKKIAGDTLRVYSEILK